jgi:hypothetical protein
VGEYTAVV